MQAALRRVRGGANHHHDDDVTVGGVHPIMFMGGLVGMLFHEFGVTIAVAILVSGVVSLSLTPMLCSRFLSPIHGMKHGRFYTVTESIFQGGLHTYERSLDWIMEHRPVMLAISAATLLVMGYLFS